MLDETAAVERPRFFHGQRLFAPDLQAVEALNRELRWLHNRSLHQPGIGNGYAVYGQAGDREVTVRPGYAVDDLGREIVLTRSIVEPVPPVAGEVDGTPTWFDLTVMYPDDEALEAAETRQGICQPPGVVRLREAPLLGWVELARDEQGSLAPTSARLRQEIVSGRRIVLARAAVLQCQLAESLSIAVRRSARPPRQPRVSCGNADPTDWAWELAGSARPLDRLSDDDLGSVLMELAPHLMGVAAIDAERVLRELEPLIRDGRLREAMRLVGQPLLEAMTHASASSDVLRSAMLLVTRRFRRAFEPDVEQIAALLDRLGLDPARLTRRVRRDSDGLFELVDAGRAVLRRLAVSADDALAAYRGLATGFHFPMVVPLGLRATIDTRDGRFLATPTYFVRLAGPRIWRVRWAEPGRAGDRDATTGRQRGLTVLVDGLTDVRASAPDRVEVHVRLLLQVVAFHVRDDADPGEVLDLELDVRRLRALAYGEGNGGGAGIVSPERPDRVTPAGLGAALRVLLRQVQREALPAWTVTWMGVEG